MSEMTPNDQNTWANTSAGLLIRQAREAKGMSIDTLSAIIKVSSRKLEALEADDQAILPDPNFTRALAQTVCRALKVDPAPVLAALPAAVATSLVAAKPSLNQPFRDFSDTGLTFERSSALNWRSTKVPSALIAPLLLLLVAAGIYVMPEHIDWASLLPVNKTVPKPVAVVEPEPVLPPEAASDAAAEVVSVAGEQSASQAVAASGSSAVASPVPAVVASAIVAPASSVASAIQARVSASAPKAPDRASEAVKPAAALASSAVLPPSVSPTASGAVGVMAKLALTAKEPAWVEVRDAAGQKVFSRVIQAGESVGVEGSAPLKVHVGNAPAISMKFNGQAVDVAAVTRQNIARLELK